MRTPEAIADDLKELFVRRDEKRSQLEVLRSELREVNKAIKGLERLKNSLANVGKAQLPAPTKSVAAEALLAVMTETPQTLDEIVSQVAMFVQNEGYSRTGLKLRVKEAVADPQFACSDEGYYLASEGKS